MKRFGRLEAGGEDVFYGEQRLCRCFDTDLGSGPIAAGHMAALFNAWLDKQEEIGEGIKEMRGKMRKIGMHIHALTGEAYEAVGLLQPPLVVMMDPKAEWIRKVREAAPLSFVVGRRYEEDAGFWQHVDPEEYARACYEMVQPDLADGWTGPNEPFGHDDHHLFAAFDEWQARYVVALRALGMEAVVNCFGTGNFTGYPDRIKITEAFPKTCAVARIQGPHDYDWPHMDRTVNGRCLRWVQWLKDLEAAGMRDVMVAVTECGLTQAVYDGPDVGWQTLDENLEVAADLYLDSLRWYNSQLVQIGQCIGCATFDWAGRDFDWGSFEHLIPYVIEGIQEMQAEVPPEQPNGGDEMIKVVDLQYNERDFAYAESKYGVAFKRAEVKPGEKVYRLVELWEKTGNASLITQVLDESGQPMANMDVAFYWEHAPDPPDPATEVYDHDWHKNFVHGPTNDKGEVGPGMGKGAYHGEGEGGPHAVWVRDPDIPSDLCYKLGMLAGTNHDHLDQKFQLVVNQEEPGPGPEPGPEPEPGGEGTIVVDLKVTGTIRVG